MWNDIQWKIQQKGWLMKSSFKKLKKRKKNTFRIPDWNLDFGEISTQMQNPKQALVQI